MNSRQNPEIYGYSLALIYGLKNMHRARCSHVRRTATNMGKANAGILHLPVACLLAKMGANFVKVRNPRCA